MFPIIGFAIGLAGLALWRRYRSLGVALLATAVTYIAIGSHVRNQAIRSFDESAAIDFFAQTTGFPAARIRLEPQLNVKEFPGRSSDGVGWGCEEIRADNPYYAVTSFVNALNICSNIDGRFALATTVGTDTNRFALFGRMIWTAPFTPDSRYRYFHAHMDYPCERARTVMGLYGVRGDFEQPAVWNCPG